jgi:hypothetical protein
VPAKKPILYTVSEFNDFIFGDKTDAVHAATTLSLIGLKAYLFMAVCFKYHCQNESHIFHINTVNRRTVYLYFFFFFFFLINLNSRNYLHWQLAFNLIPILPMIKKFTLNRISLSFDETRLASAPVCRAPSTVTAAQQPPQAQMRLQVSGCCRCRWALSDVRIDAIQDDGDGDGDGDGNSSSSSTGSRALAVSCKRDNTLVDKTAVTRIPPHGRHDTSASRNRLGWQSTEGCHGQRDENLGSGAPSESD